MSDRSEQLLDTVRQAIEDQTPLRIVGGDSKAFYGEAARPAQLLSTSGHSGIIDYTPRELVVTARAGTPLARLEQTLAEAGQMLPFEPPHFGPDATLGGALASGLSGPRRPWSGSARDAVLGVRIINGQGQLLNFGGQVMKNVAGYDLSRLMVGAMGTLGLISQASLKVIPRPAAEASRVLELDQATAIEQMNRWAARPIPLSAAAWLDGQLHLRLSGAEAAINKAVNEIGGEALRDDFWDDLREQRLTFFDGEAPLWRLSLPAATPPLALDGQQLVDWGGAQRWYRGAQEAGAVRELVASLGGHATAWKQLPQVPYFQPLTAPMLKLEQRLRASLDPKRLFNPGRLYPAL